MAFAKKCDICGAFYDVYNTNNNSNETNGIMFLNVDDEHRKYYSHNIMDCCPRCMDSIKQRIKELKENK